MTRPSLQQQNLAVAYDTEYMGKGSFMYSIHNSTISILSDNGGMTLYEKKPHKTTTDLIELTDDEAFTLYNILKARFDNYEPTETEQGLIPIPDGYAEQ